MNRVGKIIKSKDKFAFVKLTRTTACSGCHGCGNSEDDSDEIEIRVLNEKGANVGDIVEVNMDNQNVLLAAAIAYGIPFVALLSGVLLGNFIFNSELLSIVTGFVFLVISYLGINTKESQFYNSKKYVPEIVNIHKENKNICFKID
ncbi:MAG: SoxR reducing system RseC family protein [Bacillota bacterium]